MKKKAIGLVALCLVVVVAISAFFVIREANYNYGKEQGYLAGFSIGHTDNLSGEKQESQTLAGGIVPFEVGSAKWKGFMMGFPEGYTDGYNSNNSVK